MGVNVVPPFLIRTKLSRPRVSGGLVRRERLLERLELGREKSLVLVCAPAGFGKTTLVSSWLETCRWPYAWLSLDESESELEGFLAYLLAAVEGVFPEACRETRALLGGPGWTVAQVAASLINELDGVGQPFVVVLDDYHLLRERAVHELVGELLRRGPQWLHLVLISRQDPPLPLGWLRARDEVTEIRVRELRFTAGEIAAFTEQALGVAADAEKLAILEEKTEGWVAGLRLALLSLGDGAVGGGLRELNAANRYVMDYLLGEVLLRQGAGVQEFLLKTSLLERMNGSLCEAVVGAGVMAGSGQEQLEWLEQVNLFTVVLDEEREWYRYHGLFRQLLQGELARRYGEAEVAACHRRASEWYAERGQVEEALAHAVAGGDEAGAVELVRRHRHTLMNQEQWQRLERWLRLFPRHIIAEQPELLMLEAWIFQKLGRVATDFSSLNHLEAMAAQHSSVANDAQGLEGELAALRSHQLYYAADAEGALAAARHALAITPAGYSFVRNFARLHLAGAQQMAGDLRGAHSTVYEGLNEEDLAGDAAFARAFSTFGFLDWIAGDLAGMYQVAGQVLESIPAGAMLESAGWAHYWLGSVYYHRNNLVEARRHFESVLAHSSAVHVQCLLHSAFGLALTHQAQGHPASADQVLDGVKPLLAGTQNRHLMRLVAALQAELGLQRSDLSAAGRWAAGLQSMPPFKAMPLLYAPQLTYAKILLAQDSPTSRREAAAVLFDLQRFAGSIHNTRFLIETLALQALLYDREHDEHAALAALEQAVQLAQPGEFIRLFVDLGPGMAALLSRLSGLSRRGISTDYVGRILQAFVDARTPAPSAQQPSLVALLTYRELEILGLLAQRWSNNEIADELIISPQTVKRHTLNIYQKLQVKGRRPAVVKAENLGLLAGSQRTLAA